MKERERRRLAKELVRRLLDEHEGDRHDPATWILVAKALKCRVYAYHEPNGPRGEYSPCLDAVGSGVIQYNTASNPVMQAKVLIHEISHHLLWPTVTNYLFGDFVRTSYDGDPGDVRHEIARIVEDLILGQKPTPSRVEMTL